MKITNLISFISLATLLSCTTSADKNSNPSLQNDADIFLSLFPEITFAKLHLYSPSDTTDGKKFVGKKLTAHFINSFSVTKFFIPI
jgi:hypothetical protein